MFSVYIKGLVVNIGLIISSNINKWLKALLANKVFSYLLILKDITKPILTTNPFIYTLNISSS